MISRSRKSRPARSILVMSRRLPRLRDAAFPPRLFTSRMRVSKKTVYANQPPISPRDLGPERIARPAPAEKNANAGADAHDTRQKPAWNDLTRLTLIPS